MPSSSSDLPPINARGLLSQVRLGRGPGVKALRRFIDQHPEIVAKHAASCERAATNEQQKKKIMWARDAASQCRRVETKARLLSTFTSTTTGGPVVPDEGLLAKGRLSAANKAAQAAAGYTMGLLPMPSLLQQPVRHGR